MKNFLFIFLCFLSFQSVAQLTVNRKIGQRWDEYTNSAWQGQDSLIFLYDAYGNETFRFSVKGQGANWVNFFRNTKTYDANQNESTQTREVWTGSSWVNANRYTYTYNSSNSRTETLYETWYTSSNSWRNTGRITYTYNANQQRTELLSYSWDGSAWQPGSRQFMTYDASNQLITHEFFTFVNSAFAKQERRQYQYAFGFVSSLITSYPDANSNWYVKERELSLINGSATPPHIVTKSIQIRDSINSVWVDSFRTSNSYAGNLLVQRENEKYNAGNNTWTGISLDDYSYNTNNLLEEEKNLIYQSSSATYQNSERKLFTYDVNNLNDQITYFVTDGNTGWLPSAKDQLNYNSSDSLIYLLQEDFTNSTYVPNRQYFYHYADVPVGIMEESNLFSDAVLFPNPASQEINIKTDQLINGAFQTTIYNTLGRKVWSQINTRSNDALRFDISSLPNGHFILQIAELSSGKVQHFKLTKQ